MTQQFYFWEWNHYLKEICTLSFIVALIAETWEQPKRSLTEEWKKKMYMVGTWVAQLGKHQLRLKSWSCGSWVLSSHKEEGNPAICDMDELEGSTLNEI